MRWQAIDFPALASRPFMAPVARSVRKLPAVTAKRLQEFDLGWRARSEIFDEPLTPSRPRPLSSSPSGRMTFITVPNSGLPPGESAL